MGLLTTHKEETIGILEEKGTREHDLSPFAMQTGSLLVQLLTDTQSRKKVKP